MPNMRQRASTYSFFLLRSRLKLIGWSSNLNPSPPLFFFFLQPQSPLLPPCAPKRRVMGTPEGLASVRCSAPCIAGHRRSHRRCSPPIPRTRTHAEANRIRKRPLDSVDAYASHTLHRTWRRGTHVRAARTFLNSQNRVGWSDRIASRRCVGGLITDLICV